LSFIGSTNTQHGSHPEPERRDKTRAGRLHIYEEESEQDQYHFYQVGVLSETSPDM